MTISGPGGPHTLWYWFIRVLVAAHFHVVPGQVAEIDYWGGPAGASDPSHVWLYRPTVACAYRTWGRYDACLARRPAAG
jgi:hypothetical protein